MVWGPMRQLFFLLENNQDVPLAGGLAGHWGKGDGVAPFGGGEQLVRRGLRTALAPAAAAAPLCGRPPRHRPKGGDRRPFRGDQVRVWRDKCRRSPQVRSQSFLIGIQFLTHFFVMDIEYDFLLM